MQTRSQSKANITISATMKHSSISSPVTRSQSKQPSNLVFDFDEASADWLLNKNKLGNGTYSYKKTTASSGITTRSGKVLSA